MPRCVEAFASSTTARRRLVPALSIASRSRPPRPTAPRGTTEEKIAGRKRPVLVDTLGLIWGLAVLPAAPTDWDGAVEVFRRVGKSLPRLAKVWADSAYGVAALLDWIKGPCRWVLEVVSKRPGQTTFEVHKWRWIVERIFGWFNRYRRLSKDYEQNPKSSETWISIAMIHRLSRFSLPEKNKDDDLLKRPPKRHKT
jgi:transposase